MHGTFHWLSLSKLYYAHLLVVFIFYSCIFSCNLHNNLQLIYIDLKMHWKKGTIVLRKPQRGRFVVMSLWGWETLRITWLLSLQSHCRPKLCQCPYQTGAKWSTSWGAILYHIIDGWISVNSFFFLLTITFSSHIGPNIPDIIWHNCVL